LERIGKASAWFQDKFSLIFDDLVQKFQMETDNKELGKKIGNALNNLKQEIFVKLAGIKSCEKGFSPPHYLRAISKAEVEFLPGKEKKYQTPDYSESDIEHPQLFQRLKDWRSRMAKDRGLAHFQILHQRVLIQIVVNLPDNRTDLKKIKGVGKKTLEKYGKDILALVAGYRKKHGIDKVNPGLPKPPIAP
jgi:superfamily II DNA helicase RecQ